MQKPYYIHGHFRDGHATIECDDDGCKPFDLRQDLIDCGQKEPAWGYHGDSPYQTAMALLARVTGDDQLAVRLHKKFAERVVARYPREFWAGSDEILEWVENNR